MNSSASVDISLAAERLTLSQSQPACWYAIHTACRHEKRVALQFDLRQIDYYLPLYSARHRWKNGLTVDLQLPVFSGYLFAHFAASDSRICVLQVPGVLSIVGGRDGRSSVIPDATIEELKRGVDLRLIEPHQGIAIGDTVRIHSGLFEEAHAGDKHDLPVHFGGPGFVEFTEICFGKGPDLGHGGHLGA